MWSQRNCLRRYNLELADIAPSGVTIFDFDHFSAHFGKKRWMDSRYWYHSKMSSQFDAYGPLDFMPTVAWPRLRGEPINA